MTLALVCFGVLCLAGPAFAGPAEAPYEYAGMVDGTRPMMEQGPFSLDSRRLVTETEFSLHVWDVGTLKPLASVPIEPASVDGCRLIDGGKKLLVAGDHSIRIADAATSAIVSKTKVSDDQTIGADASDDGKHLVTSDHSGIQIWRPGADRPDRVIAQPVIPVSTTFSPAGTSLLVQLLGGERPYRLYELASGGEAFPLPMEGLFLNKAPAAAFDGSGKRLIVPWEKGFCVLDTRTGQAVATGTLDKGVETYGVSFSPDGSLAIVTTYLTEGFGNGPVLVFDAASGKLLHRFGSDGESAQVTPDRKWAIVVAFVQLRLGNKDIQTEVWDLATERRVQVLSFGNHFELYTASLSPDGNTIAQFLEDNHTVLWRRHDGARQVQEK